MSYLGVKNYERFQHYTDRRPPWIKFYVDLLRDREMAALPKEARLLYCLLLLVAAKEDNCFNANPVWIADEVMMPLGPVRKGLASLLESGHLIALDLLADLAPESAAPRARTRSVSVSSTSKPKPLSEGGVGGEVGEIYGHWRLARGKTDPRYARISDGRRRKITARLREFSAAELMQAIDAVALDPWEDRVRHDDLTVIFRSQEQVDKFLALRDVSRNGHHISPEEKARRTALRQP